MTKSQVCIFSVLICGAAAFLWIQHENQTRVRQENGALQEQILQLASQNQQLSNRLAAQTAAAPATDAERELLKLRGEVGGLRRELAEANAQITRRTVQQRAEQQSAQQAEQSKELAIAKMTYTKGWLLAFMAYAQQHGGQMPPDFQSATAYASESVTNETRLAPDQFEMLFNGSLNDITNAQSLIVIREKQPWQAADGGWVRGYGFGDGHSEIHKAADGNFEPWEAQHRLPPVPQTGP
jgi:hypothetical protein